MGCRLSCAKMKSFWRLVVNSVRVLNSTEPCTLTVTTIKFMFCVFHHNFKIFFKKQTTVWAVSMNCYGWDNCDISFCFCDTSFGPNEGIQQLKVLVTMDTPTQVATVPFTCDLHTAPPQQPWEADGQIRKPASRS